MKQKVIIEIISVLLILLFVYASTSKLLNYTLFVTQLKASPFLSAFAPIIAWLLPSVELGIAVMLTVKNIRIIGFLLSFILLLLFTIYIEMMLLSPVHLPCSCGGVLQALSWKQHLLFNLFFMALAATGALLEKKKKTVSHFHKAA
ncbi:MAG: hypothetical protein KGM16_13595 [Bacteroidota bacterium]|nr:hypothetical protein [Bacteroidota bacterium]